MGLPDTPAENTSVRPRDTFASEAQVLDSSEHRGLCTGRSLCSPPSSEDATPALQASVRTSPLAPAVPVYDPEWHVGIRPLDPNGPPCPVTADSDGGTGSFNCEGFVIFEDEAQQSESFCPDVQGLISSPGNCVKPGRARPILREVSNLPDKVPRAINALRRDSHAEWHVGLRPPAASHWSTSIKQPCPSKCDSGWGCGELPNSSLAVVSPITPRAWQSVSGSDAGEAPPVFVYGRKKRSAVPSGDRAASDAAVGGQTAATTMAPWAELPIPGAPSVSVVSDPPAATLNAVPFTSFDYAAGAHLKQRASGETDSQCVRRAIADSFVANPIGRQLNAHVPGWPAPQVIVFEYRVLRTHIACVVVIAGSEETPYVVQVPLASTLHRVLALTPVGRDLALVRCQVDNVPIHCDAFLPHTADYVLFEVTARPVEGDIRVSQPVPPRNVPRHGSPRPTYQEEASSSANVPHPHMHLVPRPATPPIPEDPDSDVFSSSHSGYDEASRLPVFTVFDVVHHVRMIETHGPFTLKALADVALAHTPELRRPIGFRLLRTNAAGYPPPHIVIWEEPAPSSRTFPIFHHGAAKGVCTVCVPSRKSPFWPSKRVRFLPTSDTGWRAWKLASFLMELLPNHTRSWRPAQLILRSSRVIRLHKACE